MQRLFSTLFGLREFCWVVQKFVTRISRSVCLFVFESWSWERVIDGSLVDSCFVLGARDMYRRSSVHRTEKIIEGVERVVVCVITLIDSNQLTLLYYLLLLQFASSFPCHHRHHHRCFSVFFFFLWSFQNDQKRNVNHCLCANNELEWAFMLVIVFRFATIDASFVHTRNSWKTSTSSDTKQQQQLEFPSHLLDFE